MTQVKAAVAAPRECPVKTSLWDLFFCTIHVAKRDFRESGNGRARDANLKQRLQLLLVVLLEPERGAQYASMSGSILQCGSRKGHQSASRTRRRCSFHLVVRGCGARIGEHIALVVRAANREDDLRVNKPIIAAENAEPIRMAHLLLLLVARKVEARPKQCASGFKLDNVLLHEFHST